MSFFFGKGTKVKPSYTGLQLQTASSTAPITLLWGGNRISMNLFWYDDFKAHKKKQKAGKGMGGSSTYYTYSASIQGGLCEGPIAGVGRVFKDDEKTTLAKLGMSLFLGTYPQAPWGYLTSAHPTKALNYEGVAYVAIANYDLGTSASLGNHTFEVFGREYNTAPNGHDCDCAILVKDFLTNPQYGAGFGLSRLDQDQLFSTAAAPTTGDSSYQTYCTAMGFGLSPMLSDAQEAGTILAQWALLTNTAIVWNGYKLKMVPYVRETVTGNGVTYIPPQLSEPAYTITDQDLMADPEIERVDQSDCPNVVTLNINNRFNEYNELPVPYKDQTLIDQFGERKGNDIDAPEVTDPDMAAEMVSLICARGAYIRNNYTIKLGQEYVLLEPMDTLVLVNANGFQVLLQITNIEEDDDFVFTLECEEIANNISSTGGFTNPETSTPTIIDSGVVASPVNPPIIFEPAANLTNGIAQIWCAVSGGDGTTADPNWGGCEVYVSLDDITYQSIGIIDSPARQGKLTAAMSSSALAMASVDMSMSGGELQSVTALEQLQGATLSIIENELITYQGANLTGTNLYNLTLTNRGLYSTSAAAHPIGSRFARLDENVFKYDLPANYIGQVLYLKFQSFNIWNQGYQDMEDVVAYVYTPDGKGFQVAPPTSATLSFNSTTQSDGTTILQGVVVAGASTGPYLDHYDVQVTTDGGTTWTDIAAISASGTRTTFQPATPSTNYKARIRAVSSAVGGIPSNWVESALVNSGALGGTVPNVPTGLTGTGGVLSNTMSWIAPASGSPATKYNVYGKAGHSGVLADATLVGSVGYGVLSFTHVGLNASEDWRYWVKSANGAGESTAAAGPLDLTTSSSGGGGGGGSLEVQQDEVTVVGAATVLNFEGDSVTVEEDPSGTAKVTISGGGVPASFELITTATGTGASQVISLPTTYTAEQLLVFSGALFWPDFTVSGTDLTMTANAAGDVIKVYALTTGASVGVNRLELWDNFQDASTDSVVAFASKGGILTPTVDVVVKGLQFRFSPEAGATAGYDAQIVTLDGSNVVTAIIATKNLTFSDTSLGQRSFVFDSPVFLSADVKYGILITRRTMSGSANFNARGTGDNGILANSCKCAVDTYIRAAVNTVTVGQAYSSGSNSYWFALLVDLGPALVSSRPWYWKPPKPSQFTLAASTAPNPVVTTNAMVGMIFDAGTPLAGDEQRSAYITLPDKTLPWKMVMAFKSMIPNSNYSGVGLIAWDSIGGRNYINELKNGGDINVQRFSAYGVYANGIGAAANTGTKDTQWLSIEYDGTNFIFKQSINGVAWYTQATLAKAEYLANLPDRVGPTATYNRTGGYNNMMFIEHFSLTGGGL